MHLIEFNYMNSQLKYGLRNASELLNRIKLKYKRQNQDQHQETLNDKTFLQEDSISFYQHHINHQKKIEQASLNKKSKDIQQLSLIEHIEKNQNSFCERLIIKKLQQTLKIYEEDLLQLHDNKCYLQDKIQFLIEKIRKLKEIQINNKIVAKQNIKSQEYLDLLVKEYHDSMTQAFKSQLSTQQYYNTMRYKIRMLLKSMNEDHYYMSFAEEWNKHAQLLINNKQHISQIVNEQNKKDNNEEELKFKKIMVNSKKLTFQREQLMNVDQPKPKKKLSQAQKASLLGDLKSFAKNFKFPSN